MIEVKLWNKTLGVLAYEASKKASRFAFNPDFDLKKLNVAPILMPYDPDHTGEYGPFSEASDPFFEGLPPMIADALPDDFGNDVLKNWLRQNNKDVNELNPALKLSYVGKRGLGALEFFPQLIESEKKPLNIDLKALSELSNMITATNLLPEKTTRARMEELFMVGTSAGGARSKAVVSINFNTQEILYANTYLKGFTPVIVKFDKPDEQTGKSTEVGKIEFIYHKMAVAAGIDMMPCGLLKNNGLQHFYTHRFDRTTSGTKIHMQTLAGISGMSPKQLHDYNDIFQVFIKLQLPYRDFEQQFRRMVFNYTTANDDCHTKNYAFLMNQNGEWRLSPAYDLTFPYQPQKVWKKTHPVSINNKTKNVTVHDICSVGKQFGIKNPKKIVEEVLSAISQWNKLSKQYQLSPKKAKIIGSYFGLGKDV